MSVSTILFKSSSLSTVPDPARFLASSFEPMIVTDSTPSSFADIADVTDSIIKAVRVIKTCFVSIIFFIIYISLN